MRMHGDREPHTKPILISSGGKECAPTGADNEVWSFGKQVEKVLTKFIRLRYDIKPYTAKTMEQAHLAGAPVMRPLFYNFPDDKKAWKIEDAYCYGDDVLVAPIFEAGIDKRDVYLSQGTAWVEAYTGKRYEGGQTVSADAPIDVIPVFVREGAEVLELICKVMGKNSAPLRHTAGVPLSQRERQ